MYDYLINEGVEKPSETDSLEVDIDITDRLILESQLNRNRRDSLKLIHSQDALYEQYIAVTKEISRLDAQHFSEIEGSKNITSIRADDLEYQEAKIKLEAIKLALKSVDSQIALLKQDARILTNTMYNK